MNNIYNFKRLEKALADFYVAEYGQDEDVDILRMEDDLISFRKTGIINLAYTTDNDDRFIINSILDLNLGEVYYTVTLDIELLKKEVVYQFDNEQELLSLIEDFSFDTLVDCDQEELAQSLVA